MKIKHNEIEVLKEKPFSNCKLNREQYAKVLTDIISNYADGFVLAINNEWGTGKTTFVKMWKQHLINEGFQAIYFNAWENDFNNNPLVAIMSELKTLTGKKLDTDKLFKSVVEKGAIITKNVAPALVKALVKKYVVDIDVIDEAIENATTAATKILEDEIKEYTEKKKTIKEFRIELEKFIESTESKKPLVFIVDELDRCRPNYSVEVLEQLKHFFSVKGIVFVLSIDKKHLASSIKGFYGSDKIDTDEYLRRFIDLEYSIHKPSNKVFCNYLFNYYGFEEFFHSSKRKQINELQYDTENLLEVAVLLFNKTNATLRQQEKTFALTRLILKSFRPDQYTFSPLLFLLIYIKTMHNELYGKIESNALPHQQLIDAIINIMPFENKSRYGLNLVHIAALLLHFYNNNQDHHNRIELLMKDEKGDTTTPIKINLDAIDSQELPRSLEHINQQYNYRDTSLKYLTDRISLTASIIMN